MGICMCLLRGEYINSCTPICGPLIVTKIFTGNVPFYEWKKDGPVMFAILKGKRPSRPSSEIADTTGMGDHMWTLMENCWKASPSDRPTSTQIVETISSFARAKANESISSEWISSTPLRTSYFLTENPLANVFSNIFQEARRQ